jgi:multidrug resistance efflux pump
VRSNLGITFVTVERRRIEQTLRVPGQFEYLPTARREYRTMLPGRVELLVQQYDVVEEGALLYRIDSPGWREMQQQLAEAESAIHQLTTKLESFGPLMEAHVRHEQSLLESVTVWTERVQQLDSIREAGGGRVSEFVAARATLTTARADLAEAQEKQAEMVAARAETTAGLKAARSRLHYLLDAAASVVGLERSTLEAPSESHADPHPAWASINTIEVRATESGIVESLGLTNGSWADEKSAVMTIVRSDQLRFHASGLQSDLGVLHNGLEARIVPPTPTKSGRAVSLQDTMTGTLSLGLQGDASDRTVDLLVVPDALTAWARPGVLAQLEIVTDSTAGSFRA